MLNIFYGDMPEAIYNTAVYFKNVYEEEVLMIADGAAFGSDCL